MCIWPMKVTCVTSEPSTLNSDSGWGCWLEFISYREVKDWDEGYSRVDDLLDGYWS